MDPLSVNWQNAISTVQTVNSTLRFQCDRVTLSRVANDQYRVVMYGLVQDIHPTPAMDDARALAYAVLEGDKDAALALADEVLMRYTAGDGYVSRDEMAEALTPFAEFAWVQDAHDLGNHGDTYDDDVHIGLLTYSDASARVRMKDFRRALDVVNKHKEMTKR